MRVLLAETDWAMSAVAFALKEDGFFVTRVDTAQELLEFAKFGEQDAIVFSADLPHMSAGNVIRSVRQASQRAAICLISDGTMSPVRAYQLGADTVFETPFDHAIIAPRIRAVARRMAGLALPVIKVADLSIDLSRQQVRIGNRPVRLSRYEYEILEMLALRPRQFVSRELIMNRLYAWNEEPTEKIIGVYMCNIRHKIAAAGGNTDLILTAWGRGYMLAPPLEDAILAA
ncbi:MAG: response regulator transcription factor [Paracoccaceae bacterium]